MADIMMCTNEWCKRKSTCYRARAVPSEHGQPWEDMYRATKGSMQCLSFWPIKGRKDVTPIATKEAK